MVLFIKLFGSRCHVLDFDSLQECSGGELKQYLVEKQCVPTDLQDYFLCHNGRILKNDSKIQLDINGDSYVSCHIKLRGGKGGFGSMLRAIGAQIEKTTNREACRDLSGRRMRDVNDEKKIADWLAKQSERDQEKAKMKQQRLEKLKSSPKHVFGDSTQYTSQLQENMESVEDALQKGRKSSQSSTSSLGKRKTNEVTKKRKSKKQKMWLGIEEDLSSDSSDEDSDVGSSCSSITNNSYVMGSEASSSVSGHTSEAEHTENQASSSNLQEESTPSSSIEKETACSSNITKVTSPDSSTNTLSEDSQDSSTTSSKQTALVDEKINTSLGQIEGGRTECEETVSNVEQVPKSEASSSSICDEKTSCSVSEPLDLDKYQSAEELATLGLDVLKSCLMTRGLKCGGTLQQRAERLFSVKGVSQHQIDPSLLAKPSGKHQKKGK